MSTRIIDRKSLPKVSLSKEDADNDEEQRDLIIRCELSNDYSEKDYQHDYKLFEDLKSKDSWDEVFMYWEVDKDSEILPYDYAYIIVNDKVVGRSIVYGSSFMGIIELGMNPKKKYVALEIENLLPLDWDEPVTLDMLKSECPDFDWDNIKSGMVIEDDDASYAIDDLFYNNSGEIDEYDIEERMIDNDYDDKYWD